MNVITNEGKVGKQIKSRKPMVLKIQSTFVYRSLFSVLGLLTLIVAFSSCEKECKQDETKTYYMPDSQKALVPYETGDTLVFLYEHGSQKDTVVFTGEKQRQFNENKELINECPRYHIEKYEQFNYNFYSKDSAHQFKVVNGTEYNDIRISINKNRESWYYFGKIKNEIINNKPIVVNSKEYNRYLIDTFKYESSPFYQIYNLKYGLILYNTNSISYSLVKYK